MAFVVCKTCVVPASDIFLNADVLDLRYGKRLIFTKKKMGAQTAEEQASDVHGTYWYHYHHVKCLYTGTCVGGRDVKRQVAGLYS